MPKSTLICSCCFKNIYRLHGSSKMLHHFNILYYITLQYANNMQSYFFLLLLKVKHIARAVSINPLQIFF